MTRFAVAPACRGGVMTHNHYLTKRRELFSKWGSKINTELAKNRRILKSSVPNLFLENVFQCEKFAVANCDGENFPDESFIFVAKKQQ